MPRGKPSMPTDDVESLVKRASKRCGKLRWFGPQEGTAIRSLEQALGVIFPPSYGAFLKEYGGGSGFSGIKNHDPFLDPYVPGEGYVSVYWDTL